MIKPARSTPAYSTRLQLQLNSVRCCPHEFLPSMAWKWHFLNIKKACCIGGGFPAPYDASVKPFSELARRINAELDRLFPPEIEILAEPGRFMVATAGTAVSKIIGKAMRDGKLCYYIDDGVYHTFSGIIFDHCQYHVESFKKGPTQITAMKS